VVSLWRRYLAALIGRRTSPSAGHDAALVALGAADAVIWVQCQCGWHVSLGGPVTLDYVGELVNDHRRSAAVSGDHS
jgi:hypothetical protein